MKKLIFFITLVLASNAFSDHHHSHKHDDHKTKKHKKKSHHHDHSKRSHGAHDHGLAKVDIVHEGKNIFVKAVLTGFDVFGFAQKPKNQKDKDTYLTKMTSLKTKPTDYFVLPKENKCTYKSSPEIEYEGDHSELNWNLIIQCKKKPQALSSNIIKLLPLVKKIKYSVIPFTAKDAYGKSSTNKEEKLNI